MKLDINIGFFLGTAVISLVNLLLILLDKNQLAYEIYIFWVSIVILIVLVIIQIKSSKKKGRKIR